MLSTLLLLASTSLCQTPASDWPCWLGPHRDGISRETTWASVGTFAWRVQVGLGYSCVTVVGDALFTLGHDPEQELDSVLCLDAATGEERWRHSFSAQTLDRFHGGGTQSTPVVADGRVYVKSREGHGLCLDAKTGGVIWERDYFAELELELTTYGFPASPLWLDGRLFLLFGGTLTEIDPQNGDVLRRSEDSGDGGYANPLPFDLRGRACLAVFAGPGLIVVDRESFEELYRFPWRGAAGGVNAGTPLIIDDGRIFISAAYDVGAALVDLPEEGEAQALWLNRQFRNKVSGCVRLGDFIYGFDESMLKCIDLEGEERWRVRGLGMGAVGAAGGRLLVLSSKGDLLIAEANAEEFRELWRIHLLDGGESWTTPVLAHGRVYCRSSLGELCCVDHRQPGATTVAEASPAAGEAPSAAELFRRHLEATAGPEGSAWKERTSLRLEGELESTGAGITRCPMTIHWTPEKWAQVYDLGTFGKVQTCYDGEVGWVLDPFYGDRILEGVELTEVADTSGLLRDLHWQRIYQDAVTAGPVEFGGRPCWEVGVISRRGGVRKLFFERDTGLFAGREGERECLVTHDEYRDFEGVRLPTRTVVMRPETGQEERWFIERAHWGGADPTAFERSKAVLRMLLSDEERSALNEAARERYGAYLGTYGPEDGPQEAPVWTVDIADGELALLFPPERTFALTAEEEPGWFHLENSPVLRLHFLVDEEGRATAFEFHQGPEGEPQVFERQEED